LPLSKDSGVIGQVNIFVSHCNMARFGDMVGAVSEGRDWKERVWVKY